MAIWPFKTRQREQRAYTDAVVDAIAGQVAGTGSPEASGLAAAQAAAGLWGRALASAAVPATVRRWITPAMLYGLGRALVLKGEAVYWLSPDTLVLHEASDWDVSGTVDRWSYRVTISGPASDRVRLVPGQGVLHPRINQSASEPHRGRSPLALSTLTSTTLASIEALLRNEARGNSGYVVPAPIDGMDDDDFEALKSDLSNMRGGTRMVPSMEGGWGDASAAGRLRGNNNWSPQRIGMDPPESVVSLRSDTTVAVLSACGVPPELYTGDTGGGTARREAWRQFLHGTIQPVAEVIGVELSAKLEQPVPMTFDALMASDVQGRGRAFQSLVAGGLSVADAARAAGVQVSTEPERGV